MIQNCHGYVLRLCLEFQDPNFQLFFEFQPPTFQLFSAHRALYFLGKLDEAILGPKSKKKNLKGVWFEIQTDRCKMEKN